MGLSCNPRKARKYVDARSGAASQQVGDGCDLPITSVNGWIVWHTNSQKASCTEGLLILQYNIGISAPSCLARLMPSRCEADVVREAEISDFEALRILLHGHVPPMAWTDALKT